MMKKLNTSDHISCIVKALRLGIAGIQERSRNMIDTWELR
jgi:hypothetical protein